MTLASTPYPSHQAFVRAVRTSTAAHFAAHALPVREEYNHILAPDVDWRRNLILDEVRAYIDAEVRAGKAGKRSRFALNGQKHYGTSSQAILFNLVGPLIARGDLAPLQAACEGAGIPWPAGAKAVFEIEDREVFDEQRGQPTSIDLVVQGATPKAQGLFIEAKFTESEFGRCSALAKRACATKGGSPLADLSGCYLHGLGHRYWELLEEHGLITAAQRAAPGCMLGVPYQFYRELLFAAAKGGLFVLLHDARSPVFMGSKRAILPRLIEQLPEQWREHVRVLTIQEIFAAVVASGRHDDWAGTFGVKYGMVDHTKGAHA